MASRTHDASAVRRFLAAAALATLALWAAGAERVGFAPIAMPAPRGTPVGDATEVVIEASTQRRVASFEVPLPTGAGAGAAVFAATSISLETLGAPAGGERAHAGFATLDARRGDERLTWRPFAYLDRGARGTAGTALLALPLGTDIVGLRFVARPGAGRLRLRAAPVRLLVRRSGWRWWTAGLGLCWAALGAAFARRCARRAGTAATLACLGALGFVTVGVSLSESAPFPGAEWLLGHVVRPLPELGGVDVRALFKGGHFAAFLLAAAAAAAARRRLGASAAETLAALALLALASESLQRHLLDRTASLVDVAIDGAGIACGLLLVEAVRAVRTGG